MMKDIAQKIQTIMAPFAVVLACQIQPMAMQSAIQAARTWEQNK